MTKPTERVAHLLIHASARYEHYHRALTERVRERLYVPYGKQHTFDIRSDDMRFKMCFQNHSLDSSIVQRIEGRREPETVAAIKAVVRRGDRILEIGGAYGYFTTIMALCTGPRGQVVSIEGLPSNFRVLKANVELNALNHVQLHNVFLTEDGQGTIEFDQDDTHGFWAGHRSNGSPTNKIAVPAIRLSKLLRDINYKPQRIFIDLEGYEVGVFEDLCATGILQACRPSILFETHEMYYKPSKGLDYIRDLLGSVGYYCRGLSSNWMCHHEQGPAD